MTSDFACWSGRTETIENFFPYTQSATIAIVEGTRIIW